MCEQAHWTYEVLNTRKRLLSGAEKLEDMFWLRLSRHLCASSFFGERAYSFTYVEDLTDLGRGEEYLSQWLFPGEGVRQS